MAPLDFLSPFYQRTYCQEDFLDSVDGVLGSHPGLELRAIPFYCRHPMKRWPEAFKTKRHSIKSISQGKGVWQFMVTARYMQGEESRSESGRVFGWQHPDYPRVFVMASVEPGRFFSRGVSDLVARSYPKTLTTFISHSKLYGLLGGFATSEVANLRITWASVRVRMDQDRQRQMPLVGWPQMTLERAFEWVARQDGWFQSLVCEGYASSTKVRVWLNRHGAVRTNAIVRSVFKHFLDPACQILRSNVDLFSKRARQETPQGRARPLAIEFSENIFADKQENVRFLGTLRQYPCASVSVLHANPYVHASVLDYYDGSSLEIWVLSDNRLAIVPQFRGTVQAIERIMNYIFDAYAEGSIVDFQELKK